jgi:hypothetical protein
MIDLPATSNRSAFSSFMLSGAAVVACLMVAGFAGVPQGRRAPSPPPSRSPVQASSVAAPSQPLFDWTRDATYLGAFKLPQDQIAGTLFKFNGTGLAFNDAKQTLFIVARDNDAASTLDGQPAGQRIAEISIPNPVISDSVASLPLASIVQNPMEPTEGQLSLAAVPGTPTKIGGLLVWKNRLYGTLFAYYDANDKQVLSHFSRPVDLSVTGNVAGPFRVYAPDVTLPYLKARLYSGWMAIVPPPWRTLLGGDVITGACCNNISSGSSNGPAAFAWQPDSLAANQTVVTNFYYPNTNPLAVWNTQNPYWNGTTLMGGAIFLRNSRTLLFIGSHGTGPFCYGSGAVCDDPIYSAQGGHAAPYAYQIWAYDALDLQMVVTGQRAPWSVVPYATWNIQMPFEPVTPKLNGAAYDPATGRVFIEQFRGDGDFPVIHIFQTP